MVVGIKASRNLLTLDVSLTSEQGEGVACMVIPYGTVDLEVLMALCYVSVYL